MSMRIASVGSVYLDMNAPHFPIPHPADKLVGAETVGNEYEMVLGGSAVNFARFCQHLGLHTLFIGKTGRDRIRSLLLEGFTTEGIIPALSVSDDKQTNMNVNLISPTLDSIMLSFGNANQSLSPEDVSRQLEEHVHDFDALYLGGVFKLKNLLPSLLTIVSLAKSQGKKVILDHGRVVNTVTDEEKTIVREVVKSADVYLPSKDEFLALWNVSSVEKGLALFAGSASHVVIKDAENGAFARENGVFFQIPAFVVSPKNTVGAGDVFNAGFITAQSEGKSLRESMQFANAVAGLKISQDRFPTREEIENRVKSPNLTKI